MMQVRLSRGIVPPCKLIGLPQIDKRYVSGYQHLTQARTTTMLWRNEDQKLVSGWSTESCWRTGQWHRIHSPGCTAFVCRHYILNAFCYWLLWTAGFGKSVLWSVDCDWFIFIKVKADSTFQFHCYRRSYKSLQGESWLRTGLLLLRFYRSHQTENILARSIFSNTIILPVTCVPRRIDEASRCMPGRIATGLHLRPHEGTRIYNWRLPSSVFRCRCSRWVYGPKGTSYIPYKNFRPETR